MMMMMVSSWSHAPVSPHCGANDLRSTKPKVTGSNPVGRVSSLTARCRFLPANHWNRHQMTTPPIPSRSALFPVMPSAGCYKTATSRASETSGTAALHAPPGFGFCSVCRFPELSRRRPRVRVPSLPFPAKPIRAPLWRSSVYRRHSLRRLWYQVWVPDPSAIASG
jgi:hypothetical protein